MVDGVWVQMEFERKRRKNYAEFAKKEKDSSFFSASFA
jgi:hypothetical protein